MSLFLADVDGRSRINYSVEIEFPLQETVLTGYFECCRESLVKAFVKEYCIYIDNAEVQHVVHPTIDNILGDKITCPYIHSDIF